MPWGNKAKSTGMAGMIGLAAVSGFVFGERSKLNLEGVHPDLVKVAQRCLQLSEVDFIVIDGMRTEEEQRQNIANGVSWTLRSRHLTGKAIDVVALVNNKVSYSPPEYVKISQACQKAADDLQVKITWGGVWKQRDWGHFELDKARYP
jgi:peptidoglycan L-alanyl-D-glutamate endopeptidase CwlK